MPEPASRPLRIHYLLEGSGLFGGVRVVLAQASLLSDRGHEVTVVSREPAPDWYAVEAAFVQADPLTDADLAVPDVVIATFWTTIEPALRWGCPVVHYCQGYEGLHGRSEKETAAIERAYAHPVPAMVVSPHLGAMLRDRFGRASRLVPPTLEAFWRPLCAPPEGRKPPRILVVGSIEIPLKGVETALRAVASLRSSGLECALVRLSPTPMVDRESALEDVDEFHCHLPPRRAATLFRGTDVLLAPSREPEGFGLPALEAMASGVPVVASDVSCFRGFAAGAAVLVPADDAGAFAAAGRELLADRSLWWRHRRCGLAAAARVARSSSAARVESALQWGATGGGSGC